MPKVLSVRPRTLFDILQFDALRAFLYFTRAPLIRECFFERSRFVYNTDLVRQLCSDILHEEDHHKVEELISLLQAVVRDDQEEIRTRMAFLVKKYADIISDSKAAD